MDYLSEFTEEERLALARFSTELGISRHQEFVFDKLMKLGPGRVMLKFFRNQDAIDSDFILDVEGDRYVRIDGWESQQRNKPGAQTELKWVQRTRFFINKNYAELHHIADWLYMSALGNQPWIDDCDEFGRPKKIMKCGTLERLTHEADKFMRRMDQTSAHDKLASVRMDAGHERHVADLGRGFTLVKLLTKEALSVEGAALRHCVGWGSYDNKLADGYHAYFSVRDPKGKRLATLETHSKVILQFRARFNLLPERYLLDLVDGVRGDLGWTTREEAHAAREALVPDYIVRQP